MSWAYVAIAAVTVASSVANSDSQRKAVHGQMDAAKAAQEADARQAAEADTAAQVAANAKLADAKGRRRASALALGDPAGTADSLGGPSTVLANGLPSPAARNAGYAAAAPSGTALGAGSGASRGAPRVTVQPVSPTDPRAR